MRFIPTRIHGVLDYLMGVVLVVVPWLPGFYRGGIETWLPVILGIGILVYSMFTNYELGVIHQIPMNVHLGLDLVGGILLAASPWLFGFAGYVWAPHLILGICEIGASLTTQTTPGVHGRHGRPHSIA